MGASITKYAYAVSGAHVYEKNYFRKSDMDKLLAAPSYEAVVAILQERGWTMPEDTRDSGKILDLELSRAWSWVQLSAPDPKIFRVLILRNDFHNLKAGIKCLLSDFDVDAQFCKPSSIDPSIMKECIENHAFEQLPAPFAELGQEVYDLLVRTGDGQMADVLIDRKCLDEITKEAEASGVDLLKEEMEIYTATCNIKTAFRAIKTGKDGAFLEKALSSGNKTISREKLIACAGAEKKMDELLSYLSTTSYSSGTKYLSSSPAEFEKWVDDQMLSLLLPTKYSPLGPEPLIGFYLGKEAEIRNIRIILAAKQNNLPLDVVSGRLRRLYE
ncbi:MAG: V-type ATPase subunit [Clostridiales bacterium]|nr:V-type ATPase subunit [Clostridiales bacterium]MBQ6272459.1 V-type ATPase subunit [Clostridiales bacterium]MBR4010314.1 V-type ATPase subunit [Clostridiales bacterium]